MITLKTDGKINITMPHHNKALNLAIQHATADQLAQIKEGKDVKSILLDLFHAKITHTKSDQVLLDVLKNNSVFKQFGNFTEQFKNVLETLKSQPEVASKVMKLEHSFKSMEQMNPPLLKTQVTTSGIFMESKISTILNTTQTLKEMLQTLQSQLSKIPSSEAKELSKNLIQLIDHPVFNQATSDPTAAKALANTFKTLESSFSRLLPRLEDISHPKEALLNEIKNTLKMLKPFTQPERILIASQLSENLTHDIKSQLMGIHEDLKSLTSSATADIQNKLDQLITHIDYYQLLSHLEGSNTLYIPFSWDQLEEGSMSFKKSHGEKSYCEIRLNLKEYGQVDIMLALSEKNWIEIHTFTEQSRFKTLIQHHMSTLRSLLIQAGLVPKVIRIVDKKEALLPHCDAYTPHDGDLSSGFEVSV